MDKLRYNQGSTEIILSKQAYDTILDRYRGVINCCIEDDLSGSLSDLPQIFYDRLVADIVTLNVRFNASHDTLEVFGQEMCLISSDEAENGCYVRVDGIFWELTGNVIWEHAF